MIYVALVGLTLIVVRGTIFSPLQRLWPALFQCSQCVGMWAGMCASAIGAATFGHSRALDMALVGAATSFLSLLADAVLLRLLGDPVE